MNIKNIIIEHYKNFFDLHAKGITLNEDDHLNLDWAEDLVKNCFIHNVSDSFIDSVKKEMLDWYGFDLTYEQVKNYLESKMLKFFDTVEREDYANFLGKTITGMYYPYNGSNDEYVNEFFKRLRENSTEKGYKWVG